MEHFGLGDTAGCPTSEVWGWWWYPSTSVSLLTAGLFSIILALLVVFRYNSVVVYNMRVRRPAITNSYWAGHLATLALSQLAVVTRYVIPPQLPSWLTLTLVALSLVAGTVSQFLLGLALEHQRRHRSAFPPRGAAPPSRAVTEASALLVPQGTPQDEGLGRLPLLLGGLALLPLSFGAALLTLDQDWTWITWLCAYGLQRVPTVVLGALIVAGGAAQGEGPRPMSKVLLLLGLFLLLGADLPLPLWASLLSPHCTFYLAAPLDLPPLALALGALLCFLFLRAEFVRNKEETVWRIVSERTDYFDFRDF